MSSQRPNILFVMVDQLAATMLPMYGHPVVKAPNLETLAADGVVFESAYCNSPLCAPSRASMMTGQLPSRAGVYDNAAEMPATIPTFAHYLRGMGYRTTLSGKMHFVGPDQLHGFEERLTTDIYPADFGWTPDWERPHERPSWYHNMLSVVQAGQCERSNQLDYDDEVMFHARRALFDMARDADQRPFFLLVSLTHPHDPYAITPEYWHRYDHAAIDLPAVPPIALDQLDAHSRRLRDVCAMQDYDLNEARVRNARHAYYGMVSYVDDQVGELLRVLQATGLRDNTIVIFTSDHGDMLGERGLWYKMSFFEGSARVPLIFHAPDRWSRRRIAEPVSLVDLLPTLVELADDGDHVEVAAPVDGHSLVGLLRGDGDLVWPHSVPAEYLAEGAIAPCLMLRRGRYKYIYSVSDTDQLYDLETDPHELQNLADEIEHIETRHALYDEVMRRWDPQALNEAVLLSQRRRMTVAAALTAGQHTSWDFQPYRDASRQYIRNHLDLDDLERRARFPSTDHPRPDGRTGT